MERSPARKAAGFPGRAASTGSVAGLYFRAVGNIDWAHYARNRLACVAPGKHPRREKQFSCSPKAPWCKSPSGTGAINGTLYQLQNGTQQTSTITDTYSVNSSTGRVQLSSGSGGTLPVLYLATPVTGTDATESIAAFLVGSGPTPNSNTGDPTALFGLIEPQPNGPYSLNSPPPYLFATEDSGQISGGTVIGYGSFSSGTIPLVRDISNTLGLTLSATGNSFSITVNADGTVSGAGSNNGVTPPGGFLGATNSTVASPGKVFFLPNNTVAGVRLFEP